MFQNFIRCTFLLVAISLLCISVSGTEEGPIVSTPKGRIHGKYLLSRNKRSYEAFIGIQYGVVPGRFEVFCIIYMKQNIYAKKICTAYTSTYILNLF